jgi:hypothetical protein
MVSPDIFAAIDGGYVLLSLYFPTIRHLSHQIFQDVTLPFSPSRSSLYLSQ